MQHANSLPPRTRAVLERLSMRQDLEGFTLIGGTALALRHGHRLSEDIDLTWHQPRLPCARIVSMLEELAEDGPPIDIMDPFQKQLAENDGVNLDDYHQDWLVDGVKITFFAPDPDEQAIIAGGSGDRIGSLPVAEDDVIFQLKSRVLLARRASRDLFDLWYFTEHQGRTIREIIANMRGKDRHQTIDALLAKLKPAGVRQDDPLFETKLKDAPQTPEELIARMGKLVDAHVRDMARRAALQARPGPGY